MTQKEIKAEIKRIEEYLHKNYGSVPSDEEIRLSNRLLELKKQVRYEPGDFAAVTSRLQELGMYDR